MLELELSRFARCFVEPPAVLFHGSTAAFEAFDDGMLGSISAAPSAALGHFLTSNPAIAASFTLRPEILDAAYDTLKGSSVLLDASWPLGRTENPFEAGAHVKYVVLNLRNPARIDAADYAELVDNEMDWKECRLALMSKGFDGLLIARDAEKVEVGELCVEYAADTWVAFEGRSMSWPLADGIGAAASVAEQSTAVTARTYR